MEGLEERIYEKANILKVTAGTTGKRGGDSGHGCRTVIKLENLSGDFEFVCEDNNSVKIISGGDSELDTIIMALSFVLNVLVEHRDDGPITW